MRIYLTEPLRSEARLLRISQEDRWSFLFSQIAVYSFVVALVSGVFLVVFFRPSMTCVTYHGWYHELDGVRMSEAHKSALDISFDGRGGLLMRQVHHWSALIFVAAVCRQLQRLFFTRAFRRPRGLTWLIWPVSSGGDRRGHLRPRSVRATVSSAHFAVGSNQPIH